MKVNRNAGCSAPDTLRGCTAAIVDDRVNCSGKRALSRILAIYPFWNGTLNLDEANNDDGSLFYDSYFDSLIRCLVVLGSQTSLGVESHLTKFYSFERMKVENFRDLILDKLGNASWRLFQIDGKYQIYGANSLINYLRDLYVTFSEYSCIIFIQNRSGFWLKKKIFNIQYQLKVQ